MNNMLGFPLLIYIAVGGLLAVPRGLSKEPPATLGRSPRKTGRRSHVTERRGCCTLQQTRAGSGIRQMIFKALTCCFCGVSFSAACVLLTSPETD